MQRLLSRKILDSLLRLQPWDIEYFRHLVAQWKGLKIEEENADALRIASLIADFESADPGRKIHCDQAGKIHRGHLLEIEQMVLRNTDSATLVQLAPVLRLRYRDVVGERQYATYKGVTPACDPMNAAARQSLLGDLSTLIDSIHWRYVLAPFRDRVRTALTIAALWLIILYTVVWVILVAIAGHFDKPFLAVFVTVLYAGMLGGFISALRRMQSIKDDSDSVFVIQDIAGTEFWLSLSPILGAVFAVVALLFFASGQLGGTVFPAFNDLGLGAWSFWTKLLPKAPEDYAKLFLWSFIAGFAERLVPDMIDRAIRRTESAQSTPPVPAAAAIGQPAAVAAPAAIAEPATVG
jgi:hypothetical protein